MPVVAPLHRHFSPRHLDEVAATMGLRGSPILRAHFDAKSGAWLCAEGTHRLRAAFLLRSIPVLVPVPWWRSERALERARWAAAEYGYRFDCIISLSD